MKNTQEKWTYDPASGCIHDDGKLIAEVAGAGGSNYRHARGEGNARLIAAAPEMYELLKDYNADPAEQMAWLISRHNLLARIDGKDANHE